MSRILKRLGRGFVELVIGLLVLLSVVALLLLCVWLVMNFTVTTLIVIGLASVIGLSWTLGQDYDDA